MCESGEIMKEKLLHTPDGVRDLINEEYQRKLYIQDKLQQVFRNHGCVDIEPPTFEYFDVFGSGIGATASKDLYKFFDKEGHTLVLRSDFTPSIARCAAKYYLKDNLPIKLCYMGNTFSNSGEYQGRLKETTQCGVELMGDGSIKADSEMLAMVVEALRAIGIEEFQISVGHAGFFQALLHASELTDAKQESLKELLDNKNFLGLDAFIDGLNVSLELKQLLKLLGCFNTTEEELEQAIVFAENYPDIQKALLDIKELNRSLKELQMNHYVSYELGMISPQAYYTGIIFSGYTYGMGEPIVKGGRYDKLLSYFGKSAPAIGFAFVVDQLLSAEGKKDGYLTFALGKGRLAKKTLKLLEEIGITCQEINDPDTRKLIFVNEELKLRFFLSKGPDVPTYVEYGAADIGIVGKDTILEEGRKIYEVLDLGFGKCRMCICGPESAKELLENGAQIRVATKYPKIAKDYFYNVKQQTVEIIKLNGSIELAPIVGLADVICDIVETGTTLKENGLFVLEEVCPLSARMIVNPASMKMENDRITTLIRRLKEVM